MESASEPLFIVQEAIGSIILSNTKQVELFYEVNKLLLFKNELQPLAWLVINAHNTYDFDDMHVLLLVEVVYIQISHNSLEGQDSFQKHMNLQFPKTQNASNHQEDAMHYEHCKKQIVCHTEQQNHQQIHKNVDGKISNYHCLYFA